MAKPKPTKDSDSPPPEDSRAAGYAALEALLDKQFGKGRGRTFANRVIEPLPRASTGSIVADWVTGGGIPYGRITEIYGVEGGGKTTMAVSVLGNIQRETKQGVAFVDAEFSFDPQWAAQLGVDINQLWFDQPDYGEQALEMAEAYVESGVIKGVVIDSVSALIPKSELDGEMSDQNIGLQARMMSKAMRRLAGKAGRAGVAVIFINQIREKVGVMFGSPETTSGGKALKFFASLRLDVRKGESTKSKEGDELIDGIMKLRTVKNKGSAQGRRGEVPIVYGKGLDLAGEILDLAVAASVVQKSGAHHYMGEEKLGQGRAAACEWFRQHPDVMEKLAPQLVNFLETGEVPTA